MKTHLWKLPRGPTTPTPAEWPPHTPNATRSATVDAEWKKLEQLDVNSAKLSASSHISAMGFLANIIEGQTGLVTCSVPPTSYPSI